MRRLAMLSLHTSPLAQPGTGDGGGMNVYVRELAAALARSGAECDVFTRAWAPGLPATVEVEPGLRVHHVVAGPTGPVAKESLPDVVPEFTDGVLTRMAVEETIEARGGRFEAVHANYWLSGLAGHVIKHELDLPLVSTFHTLDRVKAEAGPEEVRADLAHRRAEAEAAIIECSDAVLASCTVEAEQIADLYHADPARVRLVSPGVDHAFFAPGDRPQARRALGLGADETLLLCVGRIQPLKGTDVAVATLAELVAGEGGGRTGQGRVAAGVAGRVGAAGSAGSAGRVGAAGSARPYRLVVVGGPSGQQGQQTLDQMVALAHQSGVADRLTIVAPQPHGLLSTWYRAADITLVPSRSESFGLVALEASACGTPVVASDVGGLSTLVDDGRTGFLVGTAAAGDFAAAVRRIAEDPELAGRLSMGAVLRAKDYSWRRAATRLRAVHDAGLQGRLVECR